MPIYEYQCTACGHELEKLQKLSEPPLTDCPACGQGTLRKRVSAAAFRLKGGGWYETDFKRKNQKNVAQADADAKPKADTDGKPKAGAENKNESGSRPERNNGAASKAPAAGEKKAN